MFVECVNDLHLQMIDKTHIGHLDVASNVRAISFYKHLPGCYQRSGTRD